jgi:hypothetical protein
MKLQLMKLGLQLFQAMIATSPVISSLTLDVQVTGGLLRLGVLQMPIQSSCPIMPAGLSEAITSINDVGFQFAV